ncbi:DUF3300 domain-containing protein [Bordetella bronchialis]|uniref:DUF3300 domain-containing protein n=1 Tax=Bordetella bronchialis TaxID=463025 RepID=UPI003D0523DA
MASWYGRGARVLLLWLASLLALPAWPAADDTPALKPEEIEALVAPIALYPDPLLSQVLMASTYPLEVVHAARWSKANPAMRGDAAVKAVGDMSWDASVKSLVAFPQILEPMSDKLDWTQKLGDAFLAQPSDVFAAVQRLRGRAQAAGNLQSNAQQTVTVEPPAQGGQAPVVRIQPANPEVVYVPAYNPTVAYGTWSYPAYPPTYWPPSPAYYPGTALVTGFAWGVGLAAAGALFSDCDWGGGDVDIDYNKVKNVERNFDRTQVQGQGGRWQHDPSHRQGVAYRDGATRQQYARAVPGADKRADYRGREPAGAAGQGPAGTAGPRASADRPSGAPSAGRAAAADRASSAGRPSTADRAASTNRPSTADRAASTNQPSAANRAASTDRPVASNRGMSAASAGGNTGRTAGNTGRGASTAGRDSAFAGVGGGGAAAQRSYDRGRSSLQGSGFSRSAGGGGRGGRR